MGRVYPAWLGYARPTVWERMAMSTFTLLLQGLGQTVRGGGSAVWLVLAAWGLWWGPVAAQTFMASPTVVESHGRGDAATVQLVSLSIRAGNRPVEQGTEFVVQFVDASGAHVGAPINVKTGDPFVIGDPVGPDDANKLKITVPKAAQPVGHKMVVSRRELASDNRTLQWSTGTGLVGKATIATIAVPGLPADAGPRRWMFEVPTPNPRDPLEMFFRPGAGAAPHAITASGLDLRMATGLGPRHELFVVGNTSHVLMADGTYMFFPVDGLFGTIDIAAGALQGLFDFTSIGLSGTWLFDSQRNQTVLVGTVSREFDAAAMQVLPEPAGAALALTALALAWGWSKRVHS
jgi:hypothetical protein